MAQKLLLYATDYSDASHDALEVAAIVARQWEAKLLITHVSEHEQYPVGEQFDEEPEPNPEEVARLERVVPPDPSVPHEHRLVYGPPTSANLHPGDEIIKLAEEMDAAAIVIGTHGRSGLSRLLAGSVAESIIHRAPCRVIAVKPAAKT